MFVLDLLCIYILQLFLEFMTQNQQSWPIRAGVSNSNDFKGHKNDGPKHMSEGRIFPKYAKN